MSEQLQWWAVQVGALKLFTLYVECRDDAREARREARSAAASEFLMPVGMIGVKGEPQRVDGAPDGATPVRASRLSEGRFWAYVG